MLVKIASEANFTYTFVPVTPAEAGNGWAGAVNDVVAGNTDMFWSTFFLTSERAEVALVSSSWMDTGLIVVGMRERKKAESLGLMGYIIMPFKPFTDGLWFMVIMVMIAYSIVVFFLERQADFGHLDYVERVYSPVPPAAPPCTPPRPPIACSTLHFDIPTAAARLARFSPAASPSSPPEPTGVLPCANRAGTSLYTHKTFTKGRSIFSRSTENGPTFP